MAKAKPTANRKPAASAKPAARRPDPNPPPDAALVNEIADDVLALIGKLDRFAANMRARERLRHNKVGIKRLGFIETALRISGDFPRYFPHWLDTPKFQNDVELFEALRALDVACKSLHEKERNITVKAADMAYTDATEYYGQVKDAAKRGVDASENIYREMFEFFAAHGRRAAAPPTRKKEKRDSAALIDGKKDGAMIIESQKPKMTGGRREVIDETHTSRASFNETEDGSMKA